MQVAIEAVQAKKRAADFATAHALAERALAAAAGDRGLLAAELCAEGAEALRRLGRWSDSAAWLERAAAALDDVADGPERTKRLRHIDVLWGLLDLARGWPDLAWDAVQRVNTRPAADRADARDAALLELNVRRALDHGPEPAFALQRAVERRFGTSHEIRLRCASIVLQQTAPAPGQLALADEWLAAARVAPGLEHNERNFARLLAIIGSLNAGDLPRAAELLAELRRANAGRPATAMLNLPALALRHALDAGVAPAELRARVAEADAAWREALATLRRQPAPSHGLGPLAALDRQRLLCELLRARLHLEPGEPGVRAALALMVDAEAAGTMARALGVVVPGVDEVLGAAGDARGGTLAYFAGPERALLFVLARGRADAFELPVRGVVLERQARALTHALQSERADPAAARSDIEAATAELARMLLPADVRARLRPWRAVAIAGLESLGYVPFELLRLDGGKRLGETHAVGYLPSLAVGTWMRRHRPPLAPAGTVQALLTACPDVAPPGAGEDRALPFTAAEQHQLTGAANGVFSLRSGRDATLAASRELLAGAAYWAVLAHGIRDDRRTDPQGVLFGDGTIAWAGEFETLPLPPYVMLGCCRAGRGRIRRGDDGRHLLHGAAMLAGARAVVTPWLDVDYRDTLQLMAAVHRGLFADGLPLDEALQQARVEAAANGDALTPFLFHVHGLGGAALAPPAPAAAGAGTAATAWLAAVLAAVGLAGAVGCARHCARRRTTH